MVGALNALVLGDTKQWCVLQRTEERRGDLGTPSSVLYTGRAMNKQARGPQRCQGGMQGGSQGRDRERDRQRALLR